jgi:stage III sporulation protein SpoIIIAA
MGRGGQAPVMIEAIENQSPDAVIVDELLSREECQAARTIVGRGAAVVASIHGDSLAQILHDPERSIVLGSMASVTLSAKEAEARPDRLRQVRR